MPEPAEPNRIILAEDEPASRVLLKRQLARAGYEVIACVNGREALEAIQREGAGIILADWMMPEMDGLELCKKVRELSGLHALGFVYFILLTAHSNKEKIVEGLESGADDYLTKPYHQQELLARIRAGERIVSLQQQLLSGRLEAQQMSAQLLTLNQKLEKLANTDPLTELANRRHISDRLQEAWSLAQRHGRSLSCIMLDLDRFKSVNDTYGHDAGDLVLREAAATLRRQLRVHDVAGRFGGEEFLVLCPETPPQGAAALAERIRADLEAREIALHTTRISVTASFGVATIRPQDISPQTLVTEADKMLYLAKQNGRNQVWIAESAALPRRWQATDAAAEPARNPSLPGGTDKPALKTPAMVD